ncbi:MAG TPA: Stk1 family PASTA domain-containing Ser/Thr kinase [Candidatus Saccharimonadales bacterium]|nr:Stk1 family PASTA domain-containing Ser/Thr kinase [Candidatus Saccharimonadales bacterium]
METEGRLIGGRYRLISPLGEGGMATLWRAVDEQLDREVAVKLLRPQFGNDPGFAARFKQEARSAGSLSHPNIVSVYDYGTDAESGDQYIVMQLVEGSDLAAVLRKHGPLEIDDAVRIALGVASALEAAHRRGIVHRDVKPGNILIEDADVKVTDFGIARAVSEASMTVTGTTLGSVHYFSPEQARGDEVTGRSDVYALGIVLYEMLTGRRPFEGDSAAGVALKRLTEDPVPPTTYRPLPVGLSAIVMRALERDPDKRFPDAGSFAEALRVWQRNPEALPEAAGAAAAGAAGAAIGEEAPQAPLSPAGDPTVYVPPRVTLPSDRAAISGQPSRLGGAPPRPPMARYDEVREPQPWWIWLLAVLAVILLGTIGFLGAQVLGGLGPNATPTPSVATFALPNYVDETVTAARADAVGRLLVPAVTTQPSDTVAVDHVISTDPVAGTPVHPGQTVHMVVSGGPQQVKVPDMIGQTRDEANATLTANGLNLGRITSQPSDQPAGEVISTFPTAGTSVNKGSPVDLVLSGGPTPSPSPTPTPVPTPTPTPVPTPASSAPAS